MIIKRFADDKKVITIFNQFVGFPITIPLSLSLSLRLQLFTYFHFFPFCFHLNSTAFEIEKRIQINLSLYLVSICWMCGGWEYLRHSEEEESLKRLFKMGRCRAFARERNYNGIRKFKFIKIEFLIIGNY